MQARTYLIFSYYTFNDPLFQGLLWRIVQRSKMESDKIVLVTLERDENWTALQYELKKQGVIWRPYLFVKGDAWAFHKALLLLRLVLALIRISFTYRPRFIFTSGSIAASLAWPATVLAGVKQVVYAFEPHSLFLLEQGRFSSASLAYRLMVFFERRVMKGRSYLFTGTEAGIRWIQQTAPGAWVRKLPTSTDEELFRFLPDYRAKIRNDWRCQNKRVIAYVGKFEDLYLGEELIAFFAKCKEKRADLFFMILTPKECQEKVVQWLSEHELSTSDYYVGSCGLNDLPCYLSAADMGVVAYANRPSRKFTSPTKSGNYLLSGLPYVVQTGTSEDAEVIQQFRCGYVIPEYTAREVGGFLTYLKQCEAENLDAFRQRCREAGLSYRGMYKAQMEYQSFFA